VATWASLTLLPWDPSIYQPVKVLGWLAHARLVDGPRPLPCFCTSAEDIGRALQDCRSRPAPGSTASISWQSPECCILQEVQKPPFPCSGEFGRSFQIRKSSDRLYFAIAACRSVAGTCAKFVSPSIIEWPTQPGCSDCSASRRRNGIFPLPSQPVGQDSKKQQTGRLQPRRGRNMPVRERWLSKADPNSRASRASSLRALMK
jgi:hypothetical protein